MPEVSSKAEDILTQLVAWELLGAEGVDPKHLLRSLSLQDLVIIQANINKQTDRMRKFITVQMVEIELLYRHGFILGDWAFKKDATCVHLKYASTVASPLFPQSIPTA